MAPYLLTFLWLIQHVLSLYTDESVMISVDISITTVSQLIHKANTNIQDILETSFKNTNQDPTYYIVSNMDISSISNITYYTDNHSFRYHTILSIYFSSQSEYTNAITKYQNIFSNELQNDFLKLYETNIHNQLLQTLNTDYLSSRAVNINSFNMIQGHIIMKYNDKSNLIPSSISTTMDATISMMRSSENKWIEDNLTWILIIMALFVILCFFISLYCFWYGQRKRNRKRREKRQQIVSVEKHKLEHGLKMECEIKANIKEIDEYDDEDPFKWNNDKVIAWIKQEGLRRYCIMFRQRNVNGRDLLTQHKKLNIYIDTNDIDILVKGIKELRRKSNGFKEWKIMQQNDSKMDVKRNKLCKYDMDEMEMKNLKQRDSYSSYDDSQEEGNGSDRGKRLEISDIDEDEDDMMNYKKKRKPPKKLRQRASHRKKSKNNSLSLSSTMEIGGGRIKRYKSDEIKRRQKNKKNNKRKRNKSEQINGKQRFMDRYKSSDDTEESNIIHEDDMIDSYEIYGTSSDENQINQS